MSGAKEETPTFGRSEDKAELAGCWQLLGVGTTYKTLLILILLMVKGNISMLSKKLLQVSLWSMIIDVL